MRADHLPPPSMRNRVLRLVWGIVWTTLYRPTPIRAYGWRRMLLRLFGARVARGAHPYPSGRVWAPWNLVMEEDSCLAAETDCYNVALVTLGRNSIVSQKSYLCTASHDAHDPGFPLTARPITIGARAWVAAAAFVGPGVTIGEDAVVAAGAVAVRDVAPRAIVGGNPAVPIGERRAQRGIAA